MKLALIPAAYGMPTKPMRKKRVMDKDRFRQDLGDVAEGYQTVLSRILTQLAQPS